MFMFIVFLFYLDIIYSYKKAMYLILIGFVVVVVAREFGVDEPLMHLKL